MFLLASYKGIVFIVPSPVIKLSMSSAGSAQRTPSVVAVSICPKSPVLPALSSSSPTNCILSITAIDSPTNDVTITGPCNITVPVATPV